MVRGDVSSIAVKDEDRTCASMSDQAQQNATGASLKRQRLSFDSAGASSNTVTRLHGLGLLHIMPLDARAIFTSVTCTPIRRSRVGSFAFVCGHGPVFIAL